MSAKKFIGIKKIWYGEPISKVTSKDTGLSGAEIAAFLKDPKTVAVENSHQDTWGYTQDDPTVADYVNELNGKVYHRDITSMGAKTIAFTLGMYSYQQKADLCGGKATETSWEEPKDPVLIDKCIVAQTKTGNFIVFPNASIIGKVNFVEKNIGLGVSAVAQETGIEGLAGEKWLDESVVKDAPQG